MGQHVKFLVSSEVQCVAMVREGPRAVDAGANANR